MQAQAAKPARKTAARKGSRKTAQAAAPAPTFALVPVGELMQHIDGNDVHAARSVLMLPAPAPIILDGADLVREVVEAPSIQAADPALLAEIESEIENSTSSAGADFSTSSEAPAQATETAPTTPTSTAPVNYAQDLIAALRKRPQVSKDLDLTISAVIKGERAINLLAQKPEWVDVCADLLKRAPVAEARDPRFIAVKVWVKIAHAMTGISAGVSTYLDPYSRTICANLAAGVHLTNKGALVALSRSITFDALDTEQALVRFYNCKAGTAGTQASSSRMMLQALGVCAVVKGKTNDQMTVLDNQRAVQLFSMFTAR